ncbi:MAG: hypothetical protein ABSB67_21380 [Bryobacteraceae bacterium]|jgi:hypothetical protein
MRLSRIPAETRNAAPPPRPVALGVVVEAISLFCQAGGLRSALFIASLPERVVRSLSALAGGVLREAGEVTIPARLRRTRLYRALAGNTLQFLIEQVGQVEGTYPVEANLPGDYIVRHAAGNVLEFAGIAAFSASPVWVLAALADISGAGRELIADIAGSLQEAGLLEHGHRFESVDQLLDGLEATAGKLSDTVRVPPLDVAALRHEWSELRTAARSIPKPRLPAVAALERQWRQFREEAARQERSVFELSSVAAISAVRQLPDNVRWLSRAARVTARRTGGVLFETLLSHYWLTLSEIHQTGFWRFWMREFQPYLTGALQQFSPGRESLTERLLRPRKRPRP